MSIPGPSLSDPDESEDRASPDLDIHADGCPLTETVRVTVSVGADDPTRAEFEIDPALAVEIAMRLYRAAKLAQSGWRPDFTSGPGPVVPERPVLEAPLRTAPEGQGGVYGSVREALRCMRPRPL